MKEFDYELKNIFSGLTAKRVPKKNVVELLDCHNLEPVDGDYDLHEFVIDMDTDDYAWGNS